MVIKKKEKSREKKVIGERERKIYTRENKKSPQKVLTSDSKQATNNVSFSMSFFIYSSFCFYALLFVSGG